MEIKNEMEFFVKSEVRRRKERPGKGEKACWCALCEADIAALALNTLPSRYCHERNYGQTPLPAVREKVQPAVARAIDKVSQRPKHRPGRPDRVPGEVEVVNYAKQIGAPLVAPVLSAGGSACTCDQCRADTLAVALNHYPPKYGVNGSGRTSYQAHFEDFVRHELGQLIARAAKVVAARPHH